MFYFSCKLYFTIGQLIILEALWNYEADYNNYIFTYYIIQETRECSKSTLYNCVKIERIWLVCKLVYNLLK